MKGNALRSGTASSGLLAVLMLSAGPVLAQGGDSAEGEVRATVAAFKTALRSGDGEAALALLHPGVRIYEAGHAETKEEYAVGHLSGDMTFLSAVEMTTGRDEVVVGGEMALYASEYTTRGEFRGREIDSRGTETMVLLRTPAGWRIRQIHWSSR